MFSGLAQASQPNFMPVGLAQAPQSRPAGLTQVSQPNPILAGFVQASRPNFMLSGLTQAPQLNSMFGGSGQVPVPDPTPQELLWMITEQHHVLALHLGKEQTQGMQNSRAHYNRKVFPKYMNGSDLVVFLNLFEGAFRDHGVP